MSSNLYLEAIEAAEQLKNSAEEKVKQRLIESLTPQIKILVEKNLMGEKGDCYEDLDEEDSVEEPGDNQEQSDELDDSQEKSNELESISEVSLDEESRRILSRFITGNAKKSALREKISNLREAIKTVKKAAILAESTKTTARSKQKINLLRKNIIKEIKLIKSSCIINSDKTIIKEYYNLLKELNNMSTRRNTRGQRFLDESLDDLLEMNLFEDDEKDLEDDEEDLEADEKELEDDEKEQDDDDDDIDFDLEGDMSSSEGDVGPDTTVKQLAAIAGLLDEDDDDDAENIEISEEGLFESDLDELDDNIDEMDEMGEITDEMYTESRRRDRYLEIDENMLKREIGRMKTLREGEAKDMASHFGGGSLEGEAFVDGVELNKLHEMRNKAAKVVRKNRMLESKLTQYKKALRGMKGQLSEMNLFNAKLLYANKLMQNRELSIKQQRHVVESLDEAKTLGEAKILFESLSKSLVSSKTSRNSNKNLNESVARRSSRTSSTSVRSAQPRNSNVALDRWATLAGIKK
jgi:hypothetical protein